MTISAMRKMTAAAAVCGVILLAACPAAWGADAPAPAAAIVANLPADTVDAGRQAAADLVKLGPDAVRDVVRMVVPQGTGDDAKARTALNGLAYHVTRPGAETERAMVAGVLVESLPAAATAEVKAFLVSLLQMVGKEESVPALAKLLGDADLADPAARALVRINTPGVVPALVQALPTAKGPARGTILVALTELRARPAVPALLPLASDEDATIRRLALDALAAIGDPAAADVLAKATQAGGSFDKSHAKARYLRFAGRLAEGGDKAKCAAICREVIRTNTDARENHIVCEALATLADALAAESLPDLTAAMDSPNRQLRVAAMRLAQAMPGEAVTAALLAKLKQAAPVAQADLLDALSRRGDKVALPAVVEAIRSPEKAVRLAAVEAAGRFTGPEVVAALVAVVQMDQADEVKAAQDVLARIPGDAVLAAVATAAAKAPPAPARIALLQVLADRRATAHADVVLAAAEDKDAGVRAAAIKALGDVADSKALPRLIELLLKAPEGPEQAEASKSVIRVAERNPDAATRADPILAALAKAGANERAVLLRTLPALGSSKALDAVVADTKSEDMTIQGAAVRALADWRSADGAAPPLLNLARTLTQTTHQTIALRGYVRVVGLPSGRPAAQTVRMYEDALAAAKRPDEKRLVLGGLSAVRAVESLKVVATLLDDKDLGKEAAAAAVRIVLPQKEGQKPLQGAEVADILRKAAGVTKDDKVRKQIEDHLGPAAKPKVMKAPVETPAKPDAAPAAPKADAPAVAKPDAEGFVPLFNGKDLTGWVGAKAGYTVENGVLVCLKESSGNLYTEKPYANFVIRFEFKLTAGANNGLGIRVPMNGHASVAGMEIQILDDSAPAYKNLKPYQMNGSIYNVMPAKTGHLKPVGEWNTEEVTADGRRVTVKLNGETIVEGDLDQLSAAPAPDGKPHPGLKNVTGHLCWCGHGSRVEFRSIRIKELPATPAK